MSMLKTGVIKAVLSLTVVAAFASAPAIAEEQFATPASAHTSTVALTATNCNTFCAVVNADGSLARGHAFTTSTHVSTGAYQVLFNTSATAQKDISKCVWLATPGFGTFGGSQPATFVTTAGRSGTTNGVWVVTFQQKNGAAVAVDAPFMLEVSC